MNEQEAMSVPMSLISYDNDDHNDSNNFYI